MNNPNSSRLFQKLNTFIQIYWSDRKSLNIESNHVLRLIISKVTLMKRLYKEKRNNFMGIYICVPWTSK